MGIREIMVRSSLAFLFSTANLQIKMTSVQHAMITLHNLWIPLSGGRCWQVPCRWTATTTTDKRRRSSWRGRPQTPKARLPAAAAVVLRRGPPPPPLNYAGRRKFTQPTAYKLQRPSGPQVVASVLCYILLLNRRGTIRYRLVPAGVPPTAAAN